MSSPRLDGELPKVSYANKYGYLWPDLDEIARRHPGYGWSRVTVELRETYGYRVNHKVIQRLLNLSAMNA